MHHSLVGFKNLHRRSKLRFLDFLLRSGCGLYQGYLFSRPIPPAELAAFVNPPA